jgi:hypothetical protein
MRREPAKVLAGEGVLPAPPLPLKPTVGRLVNFVKQLISSELRNELE